MEGALSSPAVKPGRDVGLDMAKGIAMLLVILWHAKVIIPDEYKLLHVVLFFFYYIITLTAVPLFFTVSLFLVVPRLQARGARYYGKRMLRLTHVFVFWTIVQCAVALAFGAEWPGLSLGLVVQGGLSLPVAGAPVLYYLFNLLLLTTLAFGLVALPERSREPVAWLALAVGVGYLAASPWLGKLLPNFLAAFFVYVPLAYLLHVRPTVFSRPWLFLGLWWVVGALEMAELTYVGIAAASPYARVSTLLGVIAILANCSAHPADILWLRWLSVNSLGVFALHKYFQELCFLVLSGWGLCYGVVSIPPGPSLFVLAGTLFMTCCAVVLLRRTLLARYLA